MTSSQAFRAAGGPRFWSSPLFARIRHLLLAYAAVAALVAMDLATKSWAAIELRRTGPQELLGGVLRLEFRENSGAAFGVWQTSLNARKDTFLVVYAAVVATGLTALHAWRVLRGRPGTRILIGLAGLLAGTLGNLIDRADNGTVTDFIAPPAELRWPAFNLADLYMAVGLVLCILSLAKAARTLAH